MKRGYGDQFIFVKFEYTTSNSVHTPSNFVLSGNRNAFELEVDKVQDNMVGWNRGMEE